MPGEESWWRRTKRVAPVGAMLMNGYTTVMRRYFEISGRSSRSEFWMFVLVYFIIQIIAVVIDVSVLGQPFGESPGIVSSVVTLVHFIPSITAGIRRLHDTDRSGWWILIIFVPLIGIVWLIVLYCFEGTRGSNNYGPPPTV
jgi:uncharacterized membrane protein YhaH (DUF805 family)